MHDGNKYLFLQFLLPIDILRNNSDPTWWTRSDMWSIFEWDERFVCNRKGNTLVIGEKRNYM